MPAAIGSGPRVLLTIIDLSKGKILIYGIIMEASSGEKASFDSKRDSNKLSHIGP